MDTYRRGGAVVRGALIMALVAGCATAPIVPPIEIPVAVPLVVPESLEAPLNIDPPIFVDPRAKEAIIGLDSDNARKLLRMIGEMASRLRAWEAWAGALR